MVDIKRHEATNGTPDNSTRSFSKRVPILSDLVIVCLLEQFF